jgi:hypothetical protein
MADFGAALEVAYRYLYQYTASNHHREPVRGSYTWELLLLVRTGISNPEKVHTDLVCRNAFCDIFQID